MDNGYQTDKKIYIYLNYNKIEPGIKLVMSSTHLTVLFLYLMLYFIFEKNVVNVNCLSADIRRSC